MRAAERICAGFGRDGFVDLKAGLRIPPFEPQAYSMTSPPVVVNGVVVTGSSIADNSRPNMASGEVRGFDARTGALQMDVGSDSRRTARIPRIAEWRGEMAQKGGGANAWSVLAADPERDLVFVPTGSAAPDYYGGLRLGDNRYANSIVALKASTGRVAWAFQTVHHDLWDYDNASPPALVTITQDGARVPAVLQANKNGMLYVLNRETGVPIFPVEERAVPPSDIPTEAGIADATVHHRHRAAQPASIHGRPGVGSERRRPRRVPRRRRGIAQRRASSRRRAPAARWCMPSNIGGAHWGGLAVDPVRADRRRAGQPPGGDGPADPARGIRPGPRARRRNSGSATTTNTTSCAARRT